MGWLRDFFAVQRWWLVNSFRLLKFFLLALWRDRTVRPHDHGQQQGERNDNGKS